MRFIINDSLAEKDKNAIVRGLQEQSDEEYEQELLDDLNKLTTTLTKRNQHFFNCLSWLISSNRLQIIAIVPAKNKVGIVHHKFGVFTDERGDQAAFSGSLNFSQYALQYNVENIWCEYSWNESSYTRERIDKMVQLFERTWNGQSSAVRVIPIEQVKTIIHQKFPKKPLKELIEMECELAKEVMEHSTTPEVFKQKLETIIQRLKRDQAANAETDNIEIPNKWQHQDDAIAAFLKHERGVLNMATGTGKTRTSLRICKQLINQSHVDSIIISCDGTDLLHQWYRELLKLITDSNLSWGILRQYGGRKESDKFRINPRHRILLTSRLQLHLGIAKLNVEAANRTLLIHDEVHKLGSEGNRERLINLSHHIRYRLGLSATPEREYDDYGTQFIFDHIGPVIFEFTLEDAIRKGILAPFNYFPVQYRLTGKDKTRLRDVHKRKAAREKAGNPVSDEDFWNELARVYKTAEGKVVAFRSFIAKHPAMLERCIVFVETKEYGEEILEIIHKHHSVFHTYFNEDDSNVLSRFSKGEIECLLTCHRLSEGIDIQSLQNVILLSSSKAKLETIQRIGRCLRTDPHNPEKIANVVDFIRSDDKENKGHMNTDEERQAFLQHLSTIRPDN
ncbi:hypothetical protein GCM10011386_39180 [Parapedobacter defluvii]|uniref:Superfamily II DNA or RNA helicase n=2 Tax=Parapedobacter defluvii TaxID=2045106 RepID=A0ABQ1MU77_9SPHI|nr:hypothetical protein GCM10011386_39180 [Parapedobacter defluvii]